MTLAEFIAGLSALSVTGVKRKHTEPPPTISPGDMPLMYPRIPESGGGSGTFSYASRLRTMAVELVIVVQSVKLGSNAVNMATTITLMDNLHTALLANAAALCIDSWSMSNQADQVSADSYHWLIVARVEAST